MSQDEAIMKVDADYEAVLGREILVSELTGYRGDDQEDLVLDPPVKCRVVKTSRSDLHHFCDRWIDPYWNLEPVAPDPRLEGLTSLWMYGTSYNVETMEVQPARVQV